MADIWNNYLKPNKKKNVRDGQRFYFPLVLSDMSLIEATAANNFISALSKLPHQSDSPEWSCTTYNKRSETWGWQ